MSSALFNAIHDGRPERLAQLLLHHALQAQTEPRLRRLLDVPVGDVQVRLERGDDRENPRRGWRADIVVTWLAGDTWPAGERRLELKLGANLTPAQRKALADGKMHVLVVPSSRKGETVQSAERLQVLSWSEVAEAIENDNFLKTLLQQADSAYSWFCETLLEEDVRREIDSYASGGPDARWPQLYRFLSTLDVRLQEEDGYRATGGWSKSRGPGGYAYYGYVFTWRSDPRKIPSAWIGFERLVDGTVKLRLYENNELAVPTMPLDVQAAAARVIEHFAGR